MAWEEGAPCDPLASPARRRAGQCAVAHPAMNGETGDKYLDKYKRPVRLGLARSAVASVRPLSAWRC